MTGPVLEGDILITRIESSSWLRGVCWNFDDGAADFPRSDGGWCSIIGGEQPVAAGVAGSRCASAEAGNGAVLGIGLRIWMAYNVCGFALPLRADPYTRTQIGAGQECVWT